MLHAILLMLTIEENAIVPFVEKELIIKIDLTCEELRYNMIANLPIISLRSTPNYGSQPMGPLIVCCHFAIAWLLTFCFTISITTAFILAHSTRTLNIANMCMRIIPEITVKDSYKYCGSNMHSLLSTTYYSGGSAIC